ncbi:low-specificity L-threonine aldolase [Ferrimonas lipolytica]|uniref:Low-specificity L-threonine aldolase n=1 Tax=Ferrimonas lipolytica TaxID=2724191 RepID=A0A6H1UDZ1_9GAMM|nr:low-specificity L-threonine aldolase [Ferrimonas lipolytica]QIZ77305.1 low-specificity L-threonine aldolase [Ferrimonas lipolytica]
MYDFRSDTVTQPTAAMRQAMATAPVGDDVYGDDPTVAALEQQAAQMSGFEAALFTSSGTQANLLALLAHCGRGDEYICGQQAHNYKYEGGGAAVLGSIQPQPLANNDDGTISLADIEAAIKPDDIHFAQTRLISLENTIGGKVLPLEYMAQVQQLAFEKGLKLHLDGARVFNACAELGVPLADIAQHFDSFTICLSKGLAAPVGSLLVGDELLIAKARRWRKMLGGGMRQAGIIAAAGQLALSEQPSRLIEDHHHAQLLAQGLNKLNQVELQYSATNMVFATFNHVDLQALEQHLLNDEIKVSIAKQMRLVLHKDIDKAGVEKLLSSLAAFEGKVN